MYTVQMPDETEAKKILTAFTLEKWTRLLGIVESWVKTI